MERHQQEFTQLDIIGNEPDLVHGYHTRYSDFAESVGDDFFQKYRHYINDCGYPFKSGYLKARQWDC